MFPIYTFFITYVIVIQYRYLAAYPLHAYSDFNIIFTSKSPGEDDNSPERKQATGTATKPEFPVILLLMNINVLQRFFMHNGIILYFREIF